MPTALFAFLSVTLLGLLLLVVTGRGGLRRPSLSPEERARFNEVRRLSKRDPAAAQQRLKEFSRQEGTREDAERAKLRAAAGSDRVAAAELTRRLTEDLETWRVLLKDSRRRAAKDDPEAVRAVANIEQWDRETRAELAQLSDRVRQRGE